jgi:[ribosomal protein S18]-alanine N-acetyltransferase
VPPSGAAALCRSAGGAAGGGRTARAGLIRLEPATALHAEALAFVHAQAFAAGERWGPDAMALQLGLPGAFGWIAPQGGMVLARVAADEAEVLTLAVLPGRRREGLGRALLRRAMQTAAERGARAMFLEVGEANQGALVLYAGAGFVEVGRRARYYRDGSDALVLRAPILSGSGCG